MAILLSIQRIKFSAALIWIVMCAFTFTWTHGDDRSADADILFKANVSSVVEVSVEHLRLQFTSCFWSRLDPMPWVGSVVLLDYATDDNINDVIIEYGSTVQFTVGAEQILVSDTFPRLDDGQWKFVCGQWEHKDGITYRYLYINGKLEANESNKQNLDNMMNGNVRLEMAHSLAAGISGRMTCVNIWNYLLPVQTIRRLYEAHGCSDEPGENTLNWQTIVEELRHAPSTLLVSPSELRNEPVTTNPSCALPRKLLHGQLFTQAALIGHVISTEDVVSELQCQDHCLRLHTCSAYNVEQKTTVKQKTCQLISDVTGVRKNFFTYGRIFDKHNMQTVLLASCSEDTLKSQLHVQDLIP